MPLAVSLMAESGAYDLLLVDPDVDFQLDHPLAKGRMFQALSEAITGLKRQGPHTYCHDHPPRRRLGRMAMARRQRADRGSIWGAGVPVFSSMPRAATCIAKVLNSGIPVN